jgi:hypothetical protein
MGNALLHFVVVRLRGRNVDHRLPAVLRHPFSKSTFAGTCTAKNQGLHDVPLKSTMVQDSGS